MTPPELPDDLSKWPTDPYKLLGVPRDVDESALKRAYAQLIRKYKPDHAPDAFRKIRDAYDAIRNRRSSGWMGEFAVTGDVRNDAAETAGVGNEEVIGASQSQSRLRELESAWELAERGDFAGAYQRLRQLSVTAPDDEEIAVRLSWLLQLAPGLDRSSSAVTPLAGILQRVGLKGRAGDLYLRLLDGDESEALGERCGALLTKSRAQGRLLELARARWTAAAADEQWSLILSELQRLDNELVDDVRLWLSLQLAAMELAALAQGAAAQPILTRCQSAISQHGDLALTEPLLFDRADELTAVAGDLERFAEIAADPTDRDRTSKFASLVQLLKPTENANGAARRPAVLKQVQEWLRDPGEALGILDAFEHYFPALAFTLLRVINEAGDPFAIREQKLSGADLRTRLELALADKRIREASSLVAYRSSRVEVLQFCMDEFADVDDVADALAELRPGAAAAQDTFVGQLRRDIALKCVAAAGLAFWLQSES